MAIEFFKRLRSGAITATGTTIVATPLNAVITMVGGIFLDKFGKTNKPLVDETLGRMVENGVIGTSMLAVAGGSTVGFFCHKRLSESIGADKAALTLIFWMSLACALAGGDMGETLLQGFDSWSVSHSNASTY